MPGSAQQLQPSPSRTEERCRTFQRIETPCGRRPSSKKPGRYWLILVRQRWIVWFRNVSVLFAANSANIQRASKVLVRAVFSCANFCALLHHGYRCDGVYPFLLLAPRSSGPPELEALYSIDYVARKDLALCAPGQRRSPRAPPEQSLMTTMGPIPRLLPGFQLSSRSMLKAGAGTERSSPQPRNIPAPPIRVKRRSCAFENTQPARTRYRVPARLTRLNHEVAAGLFRSATRASLNTKRKLLRQFLGTYQVAASVPE